MAEIAGYLSLLLFRSFPKLKALFVRAFLDPFTLGICDDRHNIAQPETAIVLSLIAEAKVGGFYYSDNKFTTGVTTFIGAITGGWGKKVADDVIVNSQKNIADPILDSALKNVDGIEEASIYVGEQASDALFP